MIPSLNVVFLPVIFIFEYLELVLIDTEPSSSSKESLFRYAIL
jgi:hypothetical protein